MLVLSRKPSESVLIGESIRITVLRSASPVRLGIVAPDHVQIAREELNTIPAGEPHDQALADLLAESLPKLERMQLSGAEVCRRISALISTRRPLIIETEV